MKGMQFSIKGRLGLVSVWLLLVGNGGKSVWAQGKWALPQPDVVFYGTVVQTLANKEPIPRDVVWSISGIDQTIMVMNTTVVTINTTIFYISRIPFETRKVVGAPNFLATPNTLELTPADTSYTRSVTIDGEPGNLPDGKDTFTYGFASQGLIERLDLTTGPDIETFEEWSKRIFGRLVDPNSDEDSDGRSNLEEFQAGSDPQVPDHSTLIIGFSPLVDGRFKLEIKTAEGKRFDVVRSYDLDEWISLTDLLEGDGDIVEIVDDAGTAKYVFYRIRRTE